MLHGALDLLAVVLALLGGWLVYTWRLRAALRLTASGLGTGYFLALGFGSLVGAYLFGTLNLYLSGVPTIGRSVLGALFAATVAVELYKRSRGIAGSTGYVYVIPFCICIVVGRVGCLLAGLDDNTYGTPTDLPWGWDFGDRVPRHPVQIYESLSMLGFLAAFAALMKYRPDAAIAYGYYLCVGFYAGQRFLWEFLKPYGEVAGMLNLFQLICLSLIAYAAVMLSRHVHARDGA